MCRERKTRLRGNCVTWRRINTGQPLRQGDQVACPILAGGLERLQPAHGDHGEVRRARQTDLLERVHDVPHRAEEPDERGRARNRGEDGDPLLEPVDLGCRRTQQRAVDGPLMNSRPASPAGSGWPSSSWICASYPGTSRLYEFTHWLVTSEISPACRSRPAM